MPQTRSFTSGPILPSLLRFALPVLAALFLQALYGAVDLWAVGKFASAADVSAVSTGSQAMMVLTGFVTGLCMGITVLLGQTIGERDWDRAGEVLGASLWLLGLVSLLVTLAVVPCVPWIARFVHAPAEALVQTERYLRICGGGAVCIVAYNGFSALFRGMGNSRAPLLFVLISCAANILGDILLIKVFHMGAAGAAAATVAAQAASVAFSVLYVRRRGFPFPVRRESFRFHTGAAREIFRLGFPIALSDTCNEISYLIIIGFTNCLGLTASAGVGVAEKVILFLLLIPMSYMSSVSSFAAQNAGAGELGRAQRAMGLGMLTAGALGLAMSYVLIFHGDLLSRIFVKEAGVIAASALFLKATALECLILSVAYCFTGYFNGLGKTRFVMLQGLCSIFLVKIPYAWQALERMENKLFQIGLSTVWGALFTLTACAAFYCYELLRSRPVERRLPRSLPR